MGIINKDRQKRIEQRIRRILELDLRLRELNDEMDLIEEQQSELRTLLYRDRPTDYLEDVKTVIKEMNISEEDRPEVLEEEINDWLKDMTPEALASRVKGLHPEQRKLLLGEIEEPEGGIVWV